MNRITKVEFVCGYIFLRVSAKCVSFGIAIGPSWRGIGAPCNRAIRTRTLMLGLCSHRPRTSIASEFQPAEGELAIKYSGFGELEKTARGIVLDAISTVDKAFLAITKGESDYTTAEAKWFGALSEAQKGTLKKGVNAIQRQFKVPSFNVVYGTDCGANENARAQHFFAAQGGVGRLTKYVRERRTATDSARLRLTLCPRIFAKGYKRTSLTEQSQVQVVLHEMSHIGAGTRDVPDDRAGAAADAKLYELDGATHAKASGTAIDNAENWGFFLVEFYKLITPH